MTNDIQSFSFHFVFNGFSFSCSVSLYQETTQDFFISFFRGTSRYNRQFVIQAFADNSIFSNKWVNGRNQFYHLFIQVSKILNFQSSGTSKAQRITTSRDVQFISTILQRTILQFVSQTFTNERITFFSETIFNVSYNIHVIQFCIQNGHGFITPVVRNWSSTVIEVYVAVLASQFSQFTRVVYFYCGIT